MTPIRLLYVIDKMPRAGTQSHIREVFAGIDRSRFDVQLICLEAKAELGEAIEADGFTVHCLGVKNWKSMAGMKGFFRLVKLYKELKPDVVHAYLFTACVFGLLAARVAGVPVRIGSRRDLGDHMSASQVKMLSFVNRYNHAVVSNSQAVKGAAEALEQHLPQDHSVIYNGIRPKQKVQPSHYRQALPTDALVLGTLSNIRQEKDPQTLLSAFAKVKQSQPNAHLLYAGGVKDEALYAQLQAFVAAHQLTDSVHFYGAISDVDDYLSALDLFVFCSESEGFSNAVLEALSIGLPVVASRVGGNPEQVNGHCGRLFDLKQVDQCAQAIDELLALDLAQLSKAAKSRIEQEFSIESMIEQMQSLYLRLHTGR